MTDVFEDVQIDNCFISHILEFLTIVPMNGYLCYQIGIWTRLF